MRQIQRKQLIKLKILSLLLKNTFFVVTFFKKFLNVELCLLPSDINWYFPTIYIFCNTFITQKDKHCWVILPIQQFSQFWYRILRLLLVSWFPPLPPFCRGRFLKKLYLEGSVISACPEAMIKTCVGESRNPWGSIEIWKDVSLIVILKD